MAKRFGRQQKRKARERIAELETLYSAKRQELQTVIDDTQETVYAARRIIEVIKRESPNSALIEKSTVTRRGLSYASGTYICNPFVCTDIDFHTPVDMRLIDLYELEGIVKEHPFNEMVHFEVTPVSGCGHHLPRVCYSASLKALKYMHIDILSREMANTLRHCLEGLQACDD